MIGSSLQDSTGLVSAAESIVVQRDAGDSLPAWEVAKDVSGFITVLLAVYAIWVTIRENVAARQERLLTARRELYSRIILEPLVVSLRSFSASQTIGLHRDCGRVLEMGPGAAPLKDVHGACTAAATEFNNSFYGLKTELWLATNAWGDPELTSAVATIMLQLQDRVTLAVAGLPVEGADTRKVVAALHEETSEVMRVILNYTPRTD